MRLALFFTISAVVLAQAPETPKPARIEGTVVSISGGPVPRAAVTLRGPSGLRDGVLAQGASYNAAADDAGKFTIENIAPGPNYRLTAQRTGFVNNFQGLQLALESGASLKGLSISMTPQAVVSGRITNAAGDPVLNVTVQLMRRGYQQGVRTLTTASNGQTNDKGEFRIANLPPGRYYLLANPRNVEQLTGAVASGASISVSTYYPNGTDPESAAPLDIAVGQEIQGIEIRLRQAKTFAVRGKVEAGAGTSAAGLNLLAFPNASGQTVSGLINQTTSRADGSFELRSVSSGPYTIQAVARQAGGPARQVGHVDVNIVDKDITDLVITTSAGSTVSGTMRLEEGDLLSLMPTVGAPRTLTVGTVTTGGPVNAVVKTTDGVPITGTRPIISLSQGTQFTGGSSSAQMKDDGTFVMEGLSAEKYRLNISTLPKGVYLKSARLGGSDVIHAGVDLTAGSGGNLEIVLSNRPTAIQGTVVPQKDESVGTKGIALWSRDPEPGDVDNGVRLASTDQNGAFQFQGLRAGVYYVAAWEDIDLGLAQVRDFLNLMTSDAAKVEIAEGESASAQVKLIPAAKTKAAEEKLP